MADVDAPLANFDGDDWHEFHDFRLQLTGGIHCGLATGNGNGENLNIIQRNGSVSSLQCNSTATATLGLQNAIVSSSTFDVATNDSVDKTIEKCFRTTDVANMRGVSPVQTMSQADAISNCQSVFIIINSLKWIDCLELRN